ncbi:MAG: hypothetical protein KGL39_49380 [Patescibacteria group bacterium]|nr:hypothetical protein [Patescibacteria group bacterium]
MTKTKNVFIRVEGAVDGKAFLFKALFPKGSVNELTFEDKAIELVQTSATWVEVYAVDSEGKAYNFTGPYNPSFYAVISKRYANKWTVQTKSTKSQAQAQRLRDKELQALDQPARRNTEAK